MVSVQEYNAIVRVPIAVMAASYVIVAITTGMSDRNAASALIGGLSGVLGATAFILVLGFLSPAAGWASRLPLAVILAVVATHLAVVASYQEEIAGPHVPGSYLSFSRAALLCLGVELAAVARACLFGAGHGVMANTTVAWLLLVGLLHFYCVVLLGNALHYFGTQG
jgi:hypothetical protein